MGKKDKKKGMGMEKTLAKTEKNLTKKMKRQHKKTKEENVDAIVKRLMSESAARQQSSETKCGPPSARSSATLCVHPEREEMLLFGGEFYDGRHVTIYGDLLAYHVKKNEWRLVQLPGAPAPRAGHAVAVTTRGAGQMWLFGGEFSTPSGEQFHHYHDLWCLHLTQKRWEQIKSSSGRPSARSGHRMCVSGRLLLLFGGFHDNGQGCFTYMNDLHAFDLEQRCWLPLQLSGISASPRSSVLMTTLSDSRVLIYGGYSKHKISAAAAGAGAVEQGTTHTDLFHLVPQQADSDGGRDGPCVKWHWQLVRQSGIQPPLRGGMSGCLVSVQHDKLFLFGGFSDQQNDDSLVGTFYNDMYWLDGARGQWRLATLHTQRTSGRRRRRRAVPDSRGETETDVVSPCAPDDAVDMLTERMSASTADSTDAAPAFVPPPRARAALVARGSRVYLYGGHLERGSMEITLSDFYTIDTSKMDQWKTLVEQPSEVNWQGSDDENMEDDDDDDDSDDSDMDDDGSDSTV